MKIAIVDYGMGNIKSIISALKYVGVNQIVVSAEYNELRSSDKLILPGVGSFGKAMQHIREKWLDRYLKELVLGDGKPILGICLGMQLLGQSSTEDGENVGLGFIKGEVRRFESNSLKVPHVGFNQVKVNDSLKLYQGFTRPSDFYFTHSFKMISSHDINQCMCDYGNEFIASYEFNNIAGVQFHPELSQYNGLNLFRNFIKNF